VWSIQYPIQDRVKIAGPSSHVEVSA
jgi:hypothetical protein